MTLSKTKLNEAKQELEQQKIKDTLDRYKFLLGQSELFSQFIKAKGIEQEDTPAPDAPHKRKSEKEEDEELLEDEIKEEQEAVVFTESPPYIKGELRHYQIHGLNWLISLFENGISGILADEMGLGKTLQTISFLGYLKFFRSINGKHMVLVPKSTLQNWKNEFNRWIPEFNVFLFHGSKDERAAIVQNKLLTDDWEVCITSYEICLLEKSHLRKIAWQYIVIDEAHRIKNENSQLSQIMRTFQCRNRLLITGTPLQNNLRELWALLNFLLPDIFSSYDEFDDYLKDKEQDQVIHQLHAVLRPFLLRRLKNDVEKSLLPKKRINLYVGMSQMQRQWYQKILSKDVESVNGLVKDNREGKTRLLNIVMQLRKCCNHPYLFDGAEPYPFTTDQHLVDNASKMMLLDKLLTLLKQRGSRVLIFSQMSRMLDILEDYCVWKEYDYCRIDGSTAHEDRIRDIDAFNEENSSKFIFLLTTRAGGLGINLATADTVVMYDSDWNPQVDLQAEDRAHRIGQKKQVIVYRFVTENAIEEKVIERAASKLRLDQLVIQQGRVSQQNKVMQKNELVSMIRHGAQSILEGSDDAAGTIGDIEEIVKRGEERTKQLEQKFQTLGLDDLQNLTFDNGNNLYEFEGKDFSSKSKVEGWIAPSRREKKTVQYTLEEKASTSNKVPKPPKYLNIYDHHFYPDRLVELQKQDLYAFWKEQGYKPPNEDEAKRVDEAVPLTDIEREEMDKLRTSGYSNWTKRDFQAFVKGCEKYGRDSLADIASEIEGKTFEEVKEYSGVFWKNYTRIQDHEALIDKIQKGEERIRKRQEVQGQLTDMLRQYEFPLEQLYIPYGTNQKGRNYTEEEDRFLIVKLAEYGYMTDDVYELIRRDVLNDKRFRFDWFFKSRSGVEIGRRCQTLVNLLGREEEARKRQKLS